MHSSSCIQFAYIVANVEEILYYCQHMYGRKLVRGGIKASTVLQPISYHVLQTTHLASWTIVYLVYSIVGIEKLRIRRGSNKPEYLIRDVADFECLVHNIVCSIIYKRRCTISYAS